MKPRERSKLSWAPPSSSLMDRFRHAAITSDHGVCSEIGKKIVKMLWIWIHIKNLNTCWLESNLAEPKLSIYRLSYTAGFSGRDIMLHNGGNAVDSAIATLFCIGVTVPQNAGLGMKIALVKLIDKIFFIFTIIINVTV